MLSSIRRAAALGIGAGAAGWAWQMTSAHSASCAPARKHGATGDDRSATDNRQKKTSVLLSDELRARVLAVNTAALADADKEGLRVMDTRLRPIRTGQSFVGVARTVRCHNDFLTVIKVVSYSYHSDACRRCIAFSIVTASCPSLKCMKVLLANLNTQS